MGPYAHKGTIKTVIDESLLKNASKTVQANKIKRPCGDSVYFPLDFIYFDASTDQISGCGCQESSWYFQKNATIHFHMALEPTSQPSSLTRIKDGVADQ